MPADTDWLAQRSNDSRARPQGTAYRGDFNLLGKIDAT